MKDSEKSDTPHSQSTTSRAGGVFPETPEVTSLSVQPNGTDGLFALRFAIAMFAGYLLATLPQVVLDPALHSHVNPSYNHRYYPLAYLIAPIATFVFFATLIIRIRPSSASPVVSLLPFTLGCAVSAPIFRPEMPHGNLAFVFAVWLLLAALTTWIHTYEIASPKSLERVASQPRTDYLKEQGAFWRGLGLGLIAAYLGIIVTVVRELHIANAALVASADDRFRLDLYTNVEVSIMSIFMFVGPLYEMAEKVLRVSNLILQVNTDPTHVR